MTTQEIYKLASETTEKQFNNLFNDFTKEEVIKFKSLIKLGDDRFLALWTIISERYN
jgi:hypothetical protein